jgi:hypothetical protein
MKNSAMTPISIQLNEAIDISIMQFKINKMQNISRGIHFCDNIEREKITTRPLECRSNHAPHACIMQRSSTKMAI